MLEPFTPTFIVHINGLHHQSVPLINTASRSTAIMRTAELYDNAEYSDLTIRLSDGSDIHVHKVIICTKNKALRKLCQVSKPYDELLVEDF